MDVESPGMDNAGAGGHDPTVVASPNIGEPSGSEGDVTILLYVLGKYVRTWQDDLSAWLSRGRESAFSGARSMQNQVWMKPPIKSHFGDGRMAAYAGELLNASTGPVVLTTEHVIQNEVQLTTVIDEPRHRTPGRVNVDHTTRGMVRPARRRIVESKHM